MSGKSGGLRPSRRSVLIGGAGLCLLGAGGTIAAKYEMSDGHTSSPSARRSADPRAVNSIATDQKILAVTFDDGPDPEYTPTVLDILGEHNVKATFFMIGRNATKHPDLVRRALAEGHAIANHTLDHIWLDELNLGGVEYEINGGHNSLSRLNANPGELFRPPRGWTSADVAAVTASRRIRSIFWSDCLEAHFKDGIHGAAAKIVDRSTPGSIVLCHDGGALDGPNPQHEDRSRTVAALPAMLDGIMGKGLRPVTLPQLMAAGRPAD